MRGFKVAKGFENGSIILPKRQTKSSAGYDFYVASDTIIKAHSIALIPTGVKAYMESDEVLKLYVRSSMPIKKGLTLANNVGIIDSDYYENKDNDGHIMIQVMNFTDKDIDNILIKADIYSDDIKKRVKDIIIEQKRKYLYLFKK